MAGASPPGWKRWSGPGGRSSWALARIVLNSIDADGDEGGFRPRHYRRCERSGGRPGGGQRRARGRRKHMAEVRSRKGGRRAAASIFHFQQ